MKLKYQKTEKDTDISKKYVINHHKQKEQFWRKCKISADENLLSMLLLWEIMNVQFKRTWKRKALRRCISDNINVVLWLTDNIATCVNCCLSLLETKLSLYTTFFWGSVPTDSFWRQLQETTPWDSSKRQLRDSKGADIIRWVVD